MSEKFSPRRGGDKFERARAQEEAHREADTLELAGEQRRAGGGQRREGVTDAASTPEPAPRGVDTQEASSRARERKSRRAPRGRADAGSGRSRTAKSAGGSRPKRSQRTPEATWKKDVSFDEAVETVNREFAELDAIVREAGVEPKDVPVFINAIRAKNQVYELAREYPEASEERKDAIESEVVRLEDRLRGSITAEVGEWVNDIRRDTMGLPPFTEVAEDAVSQEAEPPPAQASEESSAKYESHASESAEAIDVNALKDGIVNTYMALGPKILEEKRLPWKLKEFRDVQVARERAVFLAERYAGVDEAERQKIRGEMVVLERNVARLAEDIDRVLVTTRLEPEPEADEFAAASAEEPAVRSDEVAAESADTPAQEGQRPEGPAMSLDDLPMNTPEYIPRKEGMDDLRRVLAKTPELEHPLWRDGSGVDTDETAEEPELPDTLPEVVPETGTEEPQPQETAPSAGDAPADMPVAPTSAENARAARESSEAKTMAYLRDLHARNEQQDSLLQDLFSRAGEGVKKGARMTARAAGGYARGTKEDVAGALSAVASLVTREGREAARAAVGTGARSVWEYLRSYKGLAWNERGAKVWADFGALADRYHELKPHQKINMTVVLMGGSFVPALGLVFQSGFAAQRVVTGRSLQRNSRRNLRNKVAEGKKLFLNSSDAAITARSAALGIGYTAAALGGFEYVAQHAPEWLAHMLGHDHAATAHADHAQMPKLPDDPSVSHSGMPSEAAVGAASEHAGQFPVTADHGLGYEHMVKKLWEQMQGKRIDLSGVDPHSDLYQLAHATKDNIGDVAHHIASESSHQFYDSANGASAAVGQHDVLSLGADHQLHLYDASGHEVVPHAAAVPEHAPEPQPRPEAAAAGGQHVPRPVPRPPHTMPSPHEVPQPQPRPELANAQPPLAGEHAVPRPIPRPPVPPSAAHEAMPPLHDAGTVGENPLPPGAEHAAAAHHEYLTSHANPDLRVDLSQPNVYDAGAKYPQYGGPPNDQGPIITKFLQNHPKIQAVRGITSDGRHGVLLQLDSSRQNLVPVIPNNSALWRQLPSMKPPNPLDFLRKLT